MHYLEIFVRCRGATVCNARVISTAEFCGRSPQNN